MPAITIIKKQYRQISFILVVILLLLGFTTLRQPVRKQLNSWAVLPQQEGVTELFINNSQSLARTYVPGQSQKPNFTIVNHETSSVTYHYFVQTVSNSNSQLVSQGVVQIPQNESKNVSSEFILPDLGQKIKVQLSLTFEAKKVGQSALVTQKQSVFYWMNKEGVL